MVVAVRSNLTRFLLRFPLLLDRILQVLAVEEDPSDQTLLHLSLLNPLAIHHLHHRNSLSRIFNHSSHVFNRSSSIHNHRPGMNLREVPVPNLVEKTNRNRTRRRRLYL